MLVHEYPYSNSVSNSTVRWRRRLTPRCILARPNVHHTVFILGSTKYLEGAHLAPLAWELGKGNFSSRRRSKAADVHLTLRPICPAKRAQIQQAIGLRGLAHVDHRDIILAVELVWVWKFVVQFWEPQGELASLHAEVDDPELIYRVHLR